MPQIINTNISSLNAQRNLNKSQNEQSQALQRLSSGLRINSAKDDAAGIAISTRFDSQIRGSNQAIRNAGDAISLSQTAEGAMNSMTSSLQRVRELALQSANDTNTSLDREALQQEVDQLIDEIKNISEITNFNGKNLLDGSFQNAVFQTGANAGDSITVSISKLSTDSLGTAESAGISGRESTTGLIGTVTSGRALVAGDITLNGFAITGSVASDDASSFAQGASSSIAKAAAINKSTDSSGIVATVDANVVAGASGGGLTNHSSATIAINGVGIVVSTSTTVTVTENLDAVVTAINSKSGQTGVRAVNTGDAVTGITLIADDGRNIAVGGTAAGITDDFGIVANTGVTSVLAATIGLTTGYDVFVGNVTISSKEGNDITVGSDTGDIDNVGFEVGTYSGVNAGTVSDATNATNQDVMQTGDLVLNGIAVAGSLATDDNASSTGADFSAISKAAAINKVSEQTGITAIVNANTYKGADITLAANTAGDSVINGVTVTTSYATTATVDEKLAANITAINLKSGQTGVRAEALDSDSFVLIADDGRNIDLGTGSSNIGATNDADNNTTYVSSIKLESGGAIEVSSNTANLSNSGFKVGTYGGTESGTRLDNIDVSTAAGAADAVIAVDNALQTISSRVAELGAVQNRFDNTIANLEVTTENLSAANSRIKDADFASETAALSRAQVLQQAGISVLSQANARPQQVLSLLQ